MTPEAEIISAQFTKSIIKSCAAMSYAEAQARMDDRCVLSKQPSWDSCSSDLTFTQEV